MARAALSDTAFSPPARRHPFAAWFAAASAVAVVALWCLLAARHSRAGVFWSVDVGVRYHQMQALLRGESPIFLNYAHRGVDPDARLHPMRKVFIQSSPRGHCFIYPPLFVALSAAGYRLFGWAGLYVLPLLAGIAALALTTLLAFRLRLRAAPAVPLMLGLATPLVIYSSVVWDHSAQMALTAGAAVLVWRGLGRSPFRHGAAAGALLGLGAWVHGSLLIAAVASLAALVPAWKRADVRALAAGILAGWLPMLALWLGWNAATYGSPMGVHGAATAEASHVASSLELLAPARLMKRTVAYLWGGGLADESVVAPIGPLYAIMGVWTGAAVACSAFRRARPLVPVFWVMAADTAWRSGALTGSSSGLLQATPLLLPAACAPWLWRPADERSRLFSAWASVMCLLFAAGVIAAPGYPGTDWGNRFLLTALPLLFLLALGSLERLAAGFRQPGRAALAAVAVGLVALSAAAQWHGEANMREDMRKTRRIVRALEREPADVIVTDVQIMGAAVVTSPVLDRLLLVDHPEAVPPLVRYLERTRARKVSYLGTGRSLGPVADALLRKPGAWRLRVVPTGPREVVPRFTRGEEKTAARRR